MTQPFTQKDWETLERNDPREYITQSNRKYLEQMERYAELVALLRELLAAYTSGALRMQSHDVGDPDNGIPLRAWHEEWVQGVREALGEKGDE